MDGIYIIGPTASGKTGLSVSLAERLGGEVINADSMQIYGNISIGTARPDKEEMRNVPHHLFGFIQPQESYSAAQYACDALKMAGRIKDRGRIPVFVGGTGLYMDALLYEMDFGGVQADEELRRELNSFAAQYGGKALHKMLEEMDPKSAARINPADVRRVIRGIEIYKHTGMGVGDYQADRVRRADFRPLLIGLYAADRQLIYDRINMRTDKMIAGGLIEEARTVLEKWPDSQAAKAIGYKEFADYFSGAASLADAVETVKRNTRRYAKRQNTWFKRNKEINWIDITDKNEEDMVNEVLSLMGGK